MITLITNKQFANQHKPSIRAIRCKTNYKYVKHCIILFNISF